MIARAIKALMLTCATAAAQQVPDSAFHPPVAQPAYATGSGPRLCLDEAHHNFHTLDDRFFAFGALARRDGYRVAPLRSTFTSTSLRACDLLVISNAQPSGEPWARYSYPTPSAFTAEEIGAVHRWVTEGGRLLLIADHMPLAGAASKLAAAFGAMFTDGFAFPGAARGPAGEFLPQAASAPTLFTPAEGTLPAHPISAGRHVAERVTQVRSFTGQAFQVVSSTLRPVLVLPPDYISFETRVAWQFEPDTPVREVGGWLQGATLRAGSGRVALFGEAAMFSAQLAGPDRNPVGMNAPLAEQNAQFVLNVLRLLSGVIEP